MDIYTIHDISAHRVKTEPLGHVILNESATDIAAAIQIVIDDCIQKFISERRVSEGVAVHPIQLRRGMKVRPVVTDKEWQVDFRDGDQYRILKTTAQSEGIR